MHVKARDRCACLRFWSWIQYPGLMTHPFRGLTLLLSFAAMALVPACDCSGEPSAACAGDNPPAACGMECTETAECPIGYYCSDEGCAADCLPARVMCPAPQVCSVDGRCEGDAPDGSADDAAVDGMLPDTPAIDVPGMDAGCPSVDFTATGTIPSVLLLIDRSRSMDTRFNRDGSRWEVLRDELLAPSGLIATLESNVRFGISLYTAPRRGMCPDLISVPAVLDNYDVIRSEYEMHDVGLYTPTGDAVTAVLGDLDELAPDRENTILIIATDGEPNTCENRSTDNEAYEEGRIESLGAVEAAFAMGIRTYAISVGDDVGEDHLQDVANAGLGNAPGDPDAPFYVATDTTGLQDALSEIIGGVVSCELELSGAIDPAEACMGTVSLDGMVLPCDDPDGWRAVDSTHIELTGDACDELMGGGERVTATFPCDALVI